MDHAQVKRGVVYRISSPLNEGDKLSFGKLHRLLVARVEHIQSKDLSPHVRDLAQQFQR